MKYYNKETDYILKLFTTVWERSKNPSLNHTYM